MFTFLALAVAVTLASFAGVFGAVTIAICVGLLPGAKLPWDPKAASRALPTAITPSFVPALAASTGGLTAARTIPPALPGSFRPHPPFGALTSSAGSTTVAPLAA